MASDMISGVACKWAGRDRMSCHRRLTPEYILAARPSSQTTGIHTRHCGVHRRAQKGWVLALPSIAGEVRTLVNLPFRTRDETMRRTMRSWRRRNAPRHIRTTQFHIRSDCDRWAFRSGADRCFGWTNYFNRIKFWWIMYWFQSQNLLKNSL